MTRSEDVLIDAPAGSARSGVRVLLAHGAGAGMDTPFMAAIAQAVAAQGVEVWRFEFPYMQRMRREGGRRPPDRMPILLQAFAERLAAAGGAEGCVVAGKSMGGRMASLLAATCPVRGWCALGYPFHPPGKPERLRTAHLAEITSPGLIIQGTRDPFGTQEEVEALALPASISRVWLADGNHDLVPRRASGHTAQAHWHTAAQALTDFVKRL